MRASQWFITTFKETPKDAELISHQLMLRSGMIRKLSAGLYTWLPLGLRVLQKVEQIVREEMNRAGAIEVLMPAIQPAELWQETGRWETFGGQLLTMRDSNDRAYCFGPTHEEVITDIMRDLLHSYKQLPINFYQIQTKFRDEIRPRFGVMRAREFLMKDAYSFHLTQDSLQTTYETMHGAYCRIFDRLGLRYRAVDADTGAIGGKVSQEFQVLADSGEDLIFFSDASSYAANIEQATSLIPEKATARATDTQKAMELIDTPHQKTIADLLTLNIPIEKTVKTIIVAGAGKETPMVALVLRGIDAINEIKAAKHPLVKSPLEYVDEAAILATMKVPVGFLGPVHCPIPVIVDHHALALEDFVCGANIVDKHYQGVVWERDAAFQDSWDLRNVQVGDPSPDGKGHLQSCRGIEVGHIFQLGDKYAKAMHAVVVNEAGEEQVMRMGTYGLGVSRVIAAAIEQHHDDKGILWPAAIAPFQVVVIPIGSNQMPAVLEAAENLVQQLETLGLEVLLDDRKERPGVLFADHDLIGIPHRIVISTRLLDQGMVEYKARNMAESQLIPATEIVAFFARAT